MLILASLFFHSPTPAPTPPAPLRAEQVRLASFYKLPAITLSLEDDQARALLQQLPAAPPPDPSTWTANQFALDVTALDGVTAGTQWAVVGPGGKETCTVAGFSVLLWEDADPETVSLEYSAAPCASPLFVADLDCEGDASGGEVAVPLEHAAAVVIGASDDAAGPTEHLLAQHPVVTSIHASVSAIAQDLGLGTTSRDVSVERFTVGEEAVELVQGRHFTGEGYAGCGGSDTLQSWMGLSVGGRLVAPRETTGSDVEMLLDLEGDGKIEVLRRMGTARVLEREDGAVIRTDDISFCECCC